MGVVVEFVLAPPWGEAIMADTISNILGDHCMWLLDFDLCRDITMDEAGICQATQAFRKNEPYYPRPVKGGVMWEAFRELYLQANDERLSFKFRFGWMGRN